jgi:hypothetical protein
MIFDTQSGVSHVALSLQPDTIVAHLSQDNRLVRSSKSSMALKPISDQV